MRKKSKSYRSKLTMKSKESVRLKEPDIRKVKKNDFKPEKLG